MPQGGATSSAHYGHIPTYHNYPPQVRVPQGGDLKWVGKCAEKHGANPAYSGPAQTQLSHAFVVRHYP